MSRLRLVAAQGSYKKATRLDRCTQRAKSTSNQASRSLAISGRGFRSSWQQVTFKSGDRKTLRRQPIEQRLYLLDDRQHLRRRAICIRLAGSDAACSYARKFTDRSLANHLNEGEAEQGSSIVLASMLLYAVLLRYQISVEPSYDAWYQNRVQDRFADLSVTGVLGTLRSEYGDGWWRCPNREILNVRRTIPVSSPVEDVLERATAFGALRLFGSGVSSRRPLIGSLSGLERLFITSPVGSAAS